MLVLLLCGRPGAGKSTIAHKLKDMLTGMTTIIEYDDLQEDLTSLKAWKETRRRALQHLEEYLGSASCSTILLDDNYQLASMRKQVYHVVQQLQAETLPHSICLVHVDMPTDVCLERNRQRSPERRVDEDVICNMVIEPLGSEVWERDCSLTLSLSEHDPADDVARQILAFCGENRKVVPLPIDLKEQELRLELEREVTRTSKRHTIDQVLRACVRATAQCDKRLAGSANQVRKQLFQAEDNRWKDLEELGEHFVELVVGERDGDTKDALRRSILDAIADHKHVNVTDR